MIMIIRVSRDDSDFESGPDCTADGPVNVVGCSVVGGLVAGMKWLDSDLSDGRHFLCGDRFSLADIRLYCVLAFYLKIDKNQSIPADCKNLQALMERIGSRASAKALIPSKM